MQKLNSSPSRNIRNAEIDNDEDTLSILDRTDAMSEITHDVFVSMPPYSHNNYHRSYTNGNAKQNSVSQFAFNSEKNINTDNNNINVGGNDEGRQGFKPKWWA